MSVAIDRSKLVLPNRNDGDADGYKALLTEHELKWTHAATRSTNWSRDAHPARRRHELLRTDWLQSK